MRKELLIDTDRPPRVLFIGNGVLLLNQGKSWGELIRSLAPGGQEVPLLEHIPSAMQPEAVCGTDVEEIQRQVAEKLSSQEPHEILKQLVFMDFDAILTTNYSYEIEQALTGGKWTENRRKRCHTTLDGSSNVRYNTFKCNLVVDIQGREIPVFHIHGELARKHSMVLSYYSYANAVFHLIALNKSRKNTYQEHQDAGKPVVCKSWLDYFLMGEVFTIGFGFDLSEFDIWWALERNSREYASNGRIHAFMIDKHQNSEKSSMFRSMDVDEHYFEVSDETGSYEGAYRRALKEIRTMFME